jgi:ABC-type molybdate transport system ATPase subunit
MLYEELSGPPKQRGAMADTAKTANMLLDELAALDLPTRREVAKELRKLADTFGEVPDGKTTSYVLGVLAHMLDDF